MEITCTTVKKGKKKNKILPMSDIHIMKPKPNFCLYVETTGAGVKSQTFQFVDQSECNAFYSLLSPLLKSTPSKNLFSTHFNNVTEKESLTKLKSMDGDPKNNKLLY